MANTPNTPNILPVPAWFQDAPDGGVTFQSPFEADSGTFYGVEVRTSRDLDPNALPTELVKHREQQQGLDFFEQLSAVGSPTEFQLLFTNSRFSEDFGPEDNPDPLTGVLAESSLAIYCTAGSIALRGGGVLTPNDHPQSPDSYVSRFTMATFQAGVPLHSADPQRTTQGKPNGPAERTLDRLGDSVRMLASDETDVHGTAQMFADMIYCSHLLGGLVLPRVGRILQQEYEKEGVYPGLATIALPGEFLDAVRMLSILGVADSKIDYFFVTDDVVSQTNNDYQVCMERGGIPVRMPKSRFFPEQ